MGLKNNWPQQPENGLRLDIAFREAFSGQSTNRKFAEIIPDGIYSGFTPVLSDGKVRIQHSSLSKALALINGFLLTVTLPANAQLESGMVTPGTVVAIKAVYKQTANIHNPDRDTDKDTVEIIAVPKATLNSLKNSQTAILPIAEVYNTQPDADTPVLGLKDVRKVMGRLLHESQISPERKGDTATDSEVPSLSLFHNELKKLDVAIEAIDAVLKSKDTNLDTLKEIGEYIKLNRENINLAIKAREAGGSNNETLRLANPGGATKFFTGSHTGQIRIVLPQSYTNSYVKMRVSVSSAQSEGATFDMVLSGYTQSTPAKWLMEDANQLSSDPSASSGHPVTFTHDGSKCCLCIGNKDDIWNTLSVSVLSVEVSMNSIEPEKWRTGWGIEISGTALSGRTIHNTIQSRRAFSLLNHGHSTATEKKDGFMSKGDKEKLDKLPKDAEKNHDFRGTSAIKTNRWNRIIVADGISVVGHSFIFNVKATRGGVVYNVTAMATVSHVGSDRLKGSLIQLASTDYSQIKLQLNVNLSNGNCNIDLFDGNPPAEETDQNVTVTIVPLQGDAGSIRILPSAALGGPSGSTTTASSLNSAPGRFLINEKTVMFTDDKAQDTAKFEGLTKAQFIKEAVAALHGGESAIPGNRLSTSQLLDALATKGAFSSKGYFQLRTTWDYSGNASVETGDTSIGVIDLAGCVIEVFGADKTRCSIRITTPTTNSDGSERTRMKQFIYVNNGGAYAPGWSVGITRDDQATEAESKTFLNAPVWLNPANGKKLIEAYLAGIIKGKSSQSPSELMNSEAIHQLTDRDYAADFIQKINSGRILKKENFFINGADISSEFWAADGGLVGFFQCVSQDGVVFMARGKHLIRLNMKTMEIRHIYTTSQAGITILAGDSKNLIFVQDGGSGRTKPAVQVYDANGNHVGSSYHNQNAPTQTGIQKIIWVPRFNAHYCIAGFRSLYSTPNGVGDSWVKRAELGVGLVFDDIIYSTILNALVAVGGDVNNSHPWIWKSTDGINFTSLSTDLGAQRITESPELGYLYAMRKAGIYRSRDGVSWEKISDFYVGAANKTDHWAPHNRLGLNYNKCRFEWLPEHKVFVIGASVPGHGTSVAVSKDGKDWMVVPVSSGGYPGLFPVHGTGRLILNINTLVHNQGLQFF